MILFSSVIRDGIPGLNESYLPRWIGYAFGLLLLLNHFVGSNSTTATPSQLGATSMDQTILPEGAKQIFIMSQNISDTLREDLAWGTYILLRNTNTTSVLISIRDALCVRGYWNIPENGSKAHVLDRFEEQIKWIGLSDLKDTLYFPQCAGISVRDSSQAVLIFVIGVGRRHMLLL
ncbi:hypothetical protein F0562_031287 [Nyssa sinensis]|uniref:Uncharacterized protein n=1 Tax=Nyssa sinensis TaxID=561372 RepID=A0A5J5ATC6_9ASTE|nr:hypothetical protein F0562_031287 [Nyssa sinensis]